MFPIIHTLHSYAILFVMKSIVIALVALVALLILNTLVQ
jgi:hypothetical protein